LSKNLTDQTEIDTTGLTPVHEGFSGLATANTQNINNTKEKGFSGLTNANGQNPGSNNTNQNDLEKTQK